MSTSVQSTCKKKTVTKHAKVHCTFLGRKLAAPYADVLDTNFMQMIDLWKDV